MDARIHTLSDGMALDTFWIQDSNGRAFETALQLARLNGLIEQSLSSRLAIGSELERVADQRAARRMRAIHVPSRVVIDNRASDRHTVIEINGRDRPGLLYEITRTISDQSLQISSAHITTYGMRAVDVFYVRDLVGTKVTSETRMAEIRAALLTTLRPMGQALRQRRSPPENARSSCATREITGGQASAGVLSPSGLNIRVVAYHCGPCQRQSPPSRSKSQKAVPLAPARCASIVSTPITSSHPAIAFAVSSRVSPTPCSISGDASPCCKFTKIRPGTASRGAICMRERERLVSKR